MSWVTRFRRVAPGAYAVLSAHAERVYRVKLEELGLEQVLALVDKAFGARAEGIRRIIMRFAGSEGGGPFLGEGGRGAGGGFLYLSI